MVSTLRQSKRSTRLSLRAITLTGMVSSPAQENTSPKDSPGDRIDSTLLFP